MGLSIGVSAFVELKADLPVIITLNVDLLR